MEVERLAAPPVRTIAERQAHHLQLVDALRGYAILAVLMLHAWMPPPVLFKAVDDFTGKGKFGVQLFFVVSAFTLFWSLQIRIHRDARPIHAFDVRRLFRIVPLFWIAALFYTWAPNVDRSHFAPSGVGLAHLLSTLLLVHGWYPTTMNSVVPGGWSIGAEAMFYLFVPFLFMRLKTLNRAIVLLLVSAIAVAILTPVADQRISASFPPSWRQLVYEFVYFSFPSQFPVFCCGFVLYFLLARRAGKHGDSHRDADAIAGTVSPAVLVAAAIVLMIWTLPVHVFMAALFVPLAYGLAMCPFPRVVNPPVRYLGLISYSFYIWHFCVLNRVSPFVLAHWSRSSPWDEYTGTMQGFVIFAAVLAISTAIASVSYFLIERPSMRAGKWVIARMGWGEAAGRAGQPV